MRTTLGGEGPQKRLSSARKARTTVKTTSRQAFSWPATLRRTTEEGDAEKATAGVIGEMGAIGTESDEEIRDGTAAIRVRTAIAARRVKATAGTLADHLMTGMTPETSQKDGTASFARATLAGGRKYSCG